LKEKSLGSRLGTDQHRCLAISQIQRGFQGVVDSGAAVLGFDDSVDNDVEVMSLVFIKFDLILQHPHFAIHPDSDIAVLHQFGKDILEGALSVGDQRGHDRQSCSVRQRHDSVGHFLDCLAGDRDVVVGTVGRSGSGVQQTEIIVDLRDGADG